jgi:MGT family glycosyltransferase
MRKWQPRDYGLSRPCSPISAVNPESDNQNSGVAKSNSIKGENTVGTGLCIDSFPQDSERTRENRMKRGGSILFAVTPAPGHVNPMLTIACYLRDRGHSIIFNTAEVFRSQVAAANLRFIPFTGSANFDYRHLDEAFPERKNFAPGPDQLAHDFTNAFGKTIPAQYWGVRQIMDEAEIGLIFTDVTFMGTFPLLLGPREARPPIISCGITPMLLSSIDTSPFSFPDSGPARRARNEHDNQRFQGMFQSVQDYMNQVLDDCGAPPMPRFFIDSWYTLPDLFLQFTAEGFEYPRSDMPSSIKFVGPILPAAPADFRQPEWWKDLDRSKPIVLVTQGTIANTDLNELIGPTLTGLSMEDVTVIAATGRPDATIATLAPSNAVVTPFIPFSELLPEVDVFVTNGGYGAVNQALSHGVPVIVAGETEDKAFVAARIAWTGAGINLGTSRPSPEAVRTAVHEMLNGDEYRSKAGALRSDFAKHNALKHICSYVDSFLGDGNARAKSEEREQGVVQSG